MAKRGRPANKKIDPVDRINKHLSDKAKKVFSRLAFNYVYIYSNVYELNYTLNSADKRFFGVFLEVCKYLEINSVYLGFGKPGRPSNLETILRNVFVNHQVRLGSSYTEALDKLSSNLTKIAPQYGLNNIIGNNTAQNYWRIEKEKEKEIAVIEFVQSEIAQWAKLRFL